jgi:LAS superfamily LD-carboxypeptidase LdcB
MWLIIRRNVHERGAFGIVLSHSPETADRLLAEAGVPEDRRLTLPLQRDEILFGLIAASRVVVLANGFMQMAEALALGCPAVCVHRGIGMDQHQVDPAFRQLVTFEEDAAARAESSRQAITAELQKLHDAQTQQQQFEDKVQARLDAALSESAVLESQDKQLAAEIAREQAALAAQLRARRGSGRGTALPPIGNINVVSAGGIYVNAQIADHVSALLAAAQADGVPLAGWGYRDTNAQISLRQAHCGSSQYAVYAMPSYQCSPPTAPPGASMHERGLAIDFTYNGSVIGSHGSPGYKWLAAHAADYGLYNLPSEPWHWSTNGN